ncbi:MAG: hypothetical protein J1F04_01330 [Oscillospiraceae bacterium]|nr:hypothetical protein [Oscillospiraceae bacterium]
MNFITCGENCRWQKDGFCVLEDLSRACSSLNPSSKCRYFEEKNQSLF